MIRIIFILLLSELSPAVEIGGFPFSEKELAEIRAGLSFYENLSEHFDSMPTGEAISKLGTGLRKTQKTNIYVIGDRTGVNKKLQQALLSIPGHAEYYRDRINDSRVKMDEAKKTGRDSDVEYHQSKLSHEVTDAFPTLAQLPSPETVRVLGEFLFDERGYVPRPPEPTTFEQLVEADVDKPVLLRAAKVLGDLPLLNKPVPKKTRYETPEDAIPWRQWYEEIKSGKRTFRFEGDPTEYDLNGPASKELIQRVERDRKRDEERAVGHKKYSVAPTAETAVTQIGKPSSIAWLFAALGLCGAAVWYFLRGRKTA